MPNFQPIIGHFKIHGKLGRRPGSPNVYLQGTYPGLGQITRSCYTSEIEEAVLIARDLERELFKADPSYSPITVSELCDEVYENHKGNWSPVWASYNEWLIDKRIKPYFGDIEVSAFREVHWTRFVDAFYREKPKEKLFNTRKLMRQLFRYARKQGWVTREFDMPIRDLPERKGMVLSDEQIETIISSARQFDRADLRHKFRLQVYLGRFMGLRKNEILTIECANVDLKNNILMLRLPDTRTKKHTGDLGIAPEVLPTLMAHMSAVEGRYLFPAGRGVRGCSRDFDSVWNRACVVAGVADANIHDLRHTFITVKLHVEKKHTEDVAAYVRNSPAITSKRYSHPTAEHTRHVVQPSLKAVK